MLHGYQDPLSETLSDELLLELNHYAAKDIAERAKSGSIASLIAMVATLPLSDLLTDAFVISITLVVLLLLSTLVRYFALRALPNMAVEQLDSWKKFTFGAILSMPVLWGIYLAVNIYFYGFNILTMAVIVFTAGIAAGGTMALFIWQRLAQAYVVVMILPMSMIMIITSVWNGVSISIFTGTSLLVIHLYLQAHSMNKAYWLAIYNNKLLEVKTKELILANEKSETSRVDAEKANQAKTEFLSSMSHELRTPLNAILGFAQVLEVDGDQGELNKDQIESVAYILQSGEHLLVLISQVLELSKIEQGELNISLETLSVLELMEECLPLVRNQAEKKNIQIEQKNYSDIRVRADRILFKQVILNLMSNAIKYNKDNGSITLDYFIEDNDNLTLSVSDTGVGIPMDQHVNMFKAFSRLGKERSTIEGTGIGLVITKQLVEAMKGSISFESAEDVGSTFRVSLPLAEIE